MARIDTDLLGLQIVSKEDASLVGEVDDLIIDDVACRVVGFLVDYGIREALVLPFEAALAIGEDAIIVESSSALARITEDPRMEALANKEITITDSKAITRSGRHAGSLGDFFIDTENGLIVGFEFTSADLSVYPREAAVIPASSVHRVGRDIVVLHDDYDQHLLRDGTSLERLSRPLDHGATLDAIPTTETSEAPPAPPDTDSSWPLPFESESAPPSEPAAEDSTPPETTGQPAGGEPATEEPIGEPAPVGGAAEAPTGPAEDAATLSGGPEESGPAEEESAPAEAESAPAEAVDGSPIPQPDVPLESEPLFAADVEADSPPAVPETQSPVATEPPTAKAGETESPPVKGGVPADAPGSGSTEDAFTSQQKHFLLGKRVLRRIEGPGGTLIAEEGDTVDFAMIQKAKTTDMLLILSLNVE